VSRDATPVPAMAARASQLSPAARQVHRAVLAAFITTGQPPPAAEIERLTSGMASALPAAAAIGRAGLTITRLEQFLFPATGTPVSFHIAGHATAPGR
jgi:hypothetical protein